MRYRMKILAAVLLSGTAFTSSAAKADEAVECTKTLAEKNYQQKASTEELARVIGMDCFQRQKPELADKMRRNSLTGTNRALAYELASIYIKMAEEHLENLRGEKIILKR